jgi:hypothetical protein
MKAVQGATKRKKRRKSSENEDRLSRFAHSEYQCDCGTAQASRITAKKFDEENANDNDSDNAAKDASAQFFWI